MTAPDRPEPIAIPPGKAVAVRLAAGEHLRVIDTYGGQCVDTWLYADDGSGEFMRLETCREVLESIFCEPGDVLLTESYRPIAEFVADTSPGRHDTLNAACTEGMYLRAGCAPGHANCTRNLQDALKGLGMAVPRVAPQPWNLFMLADLDAAGRFRFAPPASRPGDHVELKAVMRCVAILSACPDDAYPATNGPDGPVGAHCLVLRG